MAKMAKWKRYGDRIYKFENDASHEYKAFNLYTAELNGFKYSENEPLYRLGERLEAFVKTQDEINQRRASLFVKYLAEKRVKASRHDKHCGLCPYLSTDGDRCYCRDKGKELKEEFSFEWNIEKARHEYGYFPIRECDGEAETFEEYVDRTLTADEKEYLGYNVPRVHVEQDYIPYDMEWN